MENSVSKAYFLDTNIVFDAIYPNRPRHPDFKNFYANFPQFSIGITNPVASEFNTIAARSAELLAKYLHNLIMDNDWDKLDISKREALLKNTRDGLVNYLITNKEENKKEFVLDAFKAIIQQLINTNKKEMLELLPYLPDDYLRQQQQKVNERFVITPTNTDCLYYNKWKDTIKSLNNEIEAFKDKENQDYEIFCDIILLKHCGAKYPNKSTAYFEHITFYSNDTKFIKNAEELKEYINKKDNKSSEEEHLRTALDKIEIKSIYTKI